MESFELGKRPHAPDRRYRQPEKDGIMGVAGRVLRGAIRRPTVPVNLALQGGGSHGALAWGVLDRLLDENWVEIRAVSGTSAGAMNAAALVSGLASGGRLEAKVVLERFWTEVSQATSIGPYYLSMFDVLLGPFNSRGELAHSLLGASHQLFSPYDLNPGGRNPLRAIIERTIDVGAIPIASTAVHVTATNVRTGAPRIFSGSEVTVEALLASACLPSLFQAVEIDGEEYWDGGYTGNPSLAPLLETPGNPDLIVIQINPTERVQLPRSALEIASREREITFNDPLMKELAMISRSNFPLATTTKPTLLDRLRRIDAGRHGAATTSLRLHRICSQEMNERVGWSKIHTGKEFLQELRDEGRSIADAFLANHGRDLGQRSSFVAL